MESERASEHPTSFSPGCLHIEVSFGEIIGVVGDFLHEVVFGRALLQQYHTGISQDTGKQASKETNRSQSLIRNIFCGCLAAGHKQACGCLRLALLVWACILSPSCEAVYSRRNCCGASDFMAVFSFPSRISFSGQTCHPL